MSERRAQWLVCRWAAATERQDNADYRARRVALANSMHVATLVLFAGVEAEGPNDLYGFRQNDNFYYLTGWNQPGAVLVIDPARDVLFLPAKNPDAEKWTGVKASAKDQNAAATTGFEHVMTLPALESELLRLLGRHPRLYGLKGTPGAAKLEKLAPLRELLDAQPAIAKLRMKKSPDEIAKIQHATDISIKAHLAAWKRTAPGLYEYQVAATMDGVFAENGCERSAYTSIVGSGPTGSRVKWKSRRRGCPSAASRTLEGFRSRWTRPRSCA